MKPDMKQILYPGRLAPRWDLPKPAGQLPDSVTAVLPDGRAGYAISPPVAMLLAQLVIDENRRNVLELGAGSSSVVFAAALSSNGGGRLTSVEQSPEWCEDHWNRVMGTGIDAELIAAQPVFGIEPFPGHQYPVRERVAGRGPFDLVLVDAPQWYYGRDGALPLIWNALQPGAVIVVDDAGRPQEQWAIRRWLWVYPGLSLLGYDPTFGRNGVAVLRWGGSGKRLSLRAWLSGLGHAATSWMVRMVGRHQANAPPKERC